MEKVELYEQLLNSRSVTITDVTIEDRLILIACEVKSPTSPCPVCGQASTHINQYYERTLRDLNMGVRHVHLLVKMRQFYCPNCHRYYSESLDGAARAVC